MLSLMPLTTSTAVRWCDIRAICKRSAGERLSSPPLVLRPCTQQEASSGAPRPSPERGASTHHREFVRDEVVVVLADEFRHHHPHL